ncbi:phage holin family protein [Streptomyces sp. NPDC049687]|uniref:phage holin family protein n=1 Tax=Streptomyces sp. NPDC049687 TaxID=3365596 RepID=UPI0037AB7C33
MERMDHLEHLDKHLVDELAQVARETIRDELREQTRKQRRKATLYAASGAVALYAGAAVALAVGLALDIGLPGWAAALITAAILGVVAYALRGAARPHTTGTAERRAELSHGAEHAGQGPAVGGMPPAGPGTPYPPMPPTAPAVPGADAPQPGVTPGADHVDPQNPHHRA